MQILALGIAILTTTRPRVGGPGCHDAPVCVRVAPFARRGFDASRPSTFPEVVCELACPISDMFAAGSFLFVRIAPGVAQGTQIRLMTARGENSPREEKY